VAASYASRAPVSYTTPWDTIAATIVVGGLEGSCEKQALAHLLTRVRISGFANTLSNQSSPS
jgi:hypothetical protein